jgi:hypothetical protein
MSFQELPQYVVTGRAAVTCSGVSAYFPHGAELQGDDGVSHGALGDAKAIAGHAFGAGTPPCAPFEMGGGLRGGTPPCTPFEMGGRLRGGTPPCPPFEMGGGLRGGSPCPAIEMGGEFHTGVWYVRPATMTI